MTAHKESEAALTYHAREWKVVPLKERDKRPIGKDWVARHISRDDIPRVFKPNSNIGVQLGAVSGNLVDVDLDVVEARKLASLLPETDAAFGRQSAGLSHLLYVVQDGIKTEKFIGPRRESLCEIRSDGAQTMVPPSTHPNGEQVQWIRAGKPRTIGAAELKLAVSQLAAASIVLRAWAEGSRNDLSMVFGGCLARAGIPQDRAIEIIEAICAAAGDEEVRSRVANLNSSYDRVAKGDPAYGVPQLAKFIEEKAGQLVARYLGLKKISDRPAQAEEVVKRISGSIELWATRDGVSHATIEVSGHREHMRLRSKKFRNFLIRQLRASGSKPVTRNALDQYVETLDADAQIGPAHETALRVAMHGGDLYLDLLDDSWRAIRITSADWSIVDNPPVRFLRTRGMRPLPLPVVGSIDQLRPFVNVSSEQDFQLIVGGIVGALVPGAPHVIVMLSGEQGTAKTTLATIFRSLVDPSSAPVRSMPRNEHELFISAQASWLLAFDNVSFIPSSTADALCRITSGGAFSARALYSDDEEMILEARRPILMNGIPMLAQRPDLLDRSISLILPVIDPQNRRPEREFNAAFLSEAPAIMGAICTALSSVLRNRESVVLHNPPRMADFARTMAAAEEGLGWPPGTFLKAYEANREAALTDLASQDPLIEVIRRCLSERGGEIRQPATELLRTLIDAAKDEERRLRSFPKQPNQLARQLRRLAPVMRSMGIEVNLDFERDRTTHVKTIRLYSEKLAETM